MCIGVGSGMMGENIIKLWKGWGLLGRTGQGFTVEYPHNAARKLSSEQRESLDSEVNSSATTFRKMERRV